MQMTAKDSLKDVPVMLKAAVKSINVNKHVVKNSREALPAIAFAIVTFLHIEHRK
jgi:hypothetical protein